MPLFGDFFLVISEDGSITVNLTPPANIGGASLVFNMSKRLGNYPPLVQKFSSSGLDGVSGITITNSGQGVFVVSLNPAEVSGLDQGAYAVWVDRTDTGQATRIYQGWRLQGV